jgi:hypothetical protein
MIGIAATCYHLANGLCTFAMTWGITVGRNSQRMAAAAMTGVGLVLFGIGVSAVNGFLPKNKKPVAAAVAPAPVLSTYGSVDVAASSATPAADSTN